MCGTLTRSNSRLLLPPSFPRLKRRPEFDYNRPVRQSERQPCESLRQYAHSRAHLRDPALRKYSTQTRALQEQRIRATKDGTNANVKALYVADVALANSPDAKPLPAIHRNDEHTNSSDTEPVALKVKYRLTATSFLDKTGVNACHKLTPTTSQQRDPRTRQPGAFKIRYHPGLSLTEKAYFEKRLSDNLRSKGLVPDTPKASSSEQSEWASLAFQTHVQWTAQHAGASTSHPKAKPNIGVAISQSGLLELHDATLASHKLHTVLQLSVASPNLHPTDFYRLNPPGTHLPSLRTLGGLLKVVPGRDPETLARLPYWILLFSSPLAAHTYQTTFLRLSNELAATQESQVSTDEPGPKPQPNQPSSSASSRSHLLDFTLLPPSLPSPPADSLTAHLPPFPLPLDASLFLHSDHTALDSHSRPSWPLLVRTYPPTHNFSFTASMLNTMIEEDGTARGLPWNMFPGVENLREGVERVKEIMAAERGSGVVDAFFSAQSKDSQKKKKGNGRARTKEKNGGLDDGDGEEEENGDKGWIIRARTENEALRFKRAWDRRTVLKVGRKNAAEGETWPDPMPEVRVEVLW